MPKRRVYNLASEFITPRAVSDATLQASASKR